MKNNKFLPNRFKPVASPYLSYVLGVIMGDGSVYKTIRRYKHKKDQYSYIIHLSVRENDFAEEFAHSLSKLFDKEVKVIKCDEKGNDRGIFYKVFLASKDFYEWYNSTDIFEWGIKYPGNFIKGFYDSDGSFSYFKSKGCKYPVVRMVGSDKSFFERLQKLLASNYRIKSIFKSRGVPKPTVLNKMTVFWRKEVYELGIFNKKDVGTFLKIVEGSNKLNKKIEEE